ncbi:MAG: hypothetical protein EBR10_11245 [Planctomycetes bacterium]|nr:hypothetical protein [Planctomycetota bacterium]
MQPLSDLETNWSVDVSGLHIAVSPGAVDECIRDNPPRTDNGFWNEAEWADLKDFVLDMWRGDVARRRVAKRILRPHVSSLRTRLSPVVVRFGSKFQRRRA